MCSWADADFPIGCATAYDRSLKQVGLVGTHAYSVLEVRELPDVTPGMQSTLADIWKGEGTAARGRAVKAQYLSEHGTLRLLKIRNPWGKKEWSGDWGSTSELWTQRLGAQLGRTRKDDGEFWMSWHDFLCRFNVVDVCKANPGWHALSLDIRLAAHSTCGYEVEVETTGPAFVMALQRRKRGDTAGGYWFADLNVILCELDDPDADGAARWRPLRALLRGPTRDATLEVLFQAGRTYLLLPFSTRTAAAAATSPGPTEAVLRVYGASRLRARQRSVCHSTAVPTMLQALAFSAPKDTSLPAASRTFSALQTTALATGGVLLTAAAPGVALALAVNPATQPLRLRLAAAGRDMAVLLLAGAAVTVPPRSQRIIAMFTSVSVSDRSRWRLAFAAAGEGGAMPECPSPLPPVPPPAAGEAPPSAAARLDTHDKWSAAQRAPIQLAEMFAPSAMSPAAARLEAPSGECGGARQRFRAAVICSTATASAGLGAAPF